MSIIDAAIQDKKPQQPKAKPIPPKTQRVCIDLPGEDFSCYLTEPNLEVMLRKHRDVVIDINVKEGKSYTIEANSGDFYSPKDKKLISYKKKQKVSFKDGERLHLWVGRSFKGELIIKDGQRIIGQYAPMKLDMVNYGDDPATKPEPLVIAIGFKKSPSIGICTPEDPFGTKNNEALQREMYAKWIRDIKSYGTQYDYDQYLIPSNTTEPEVQEYAVVAAVEPHEIQPQVRAQLDTGVTVQDSPEKIFAPITAASVLTNAADKFWDTLTTNAGKEIAGYTQEHWRQFGKLTMNVTIQKAKLGKYRVVFKGRMITRMAGKSAAQLAGWAMQKKTISRPMGSPGAAWIDGNHSKTGKAGLGGAKRISITAASNFKSGLKIQAIGTVIDLYGDVKAVYGDEGSNDFSEFLGRAGVTFVKAGITAAVGSLAAVWISAGTIALAAGAGLAAPALVVAGIVVGGYILTATLVDLIDDSFQIKERAAQAAK